jgi:hypothetical protein
MGGRVAWSSTPISATFLALTGRWHPQIGAPLGPGSGQIGMGQRLALIGVQKHNVAGLGSRLSRCEPQPPRSTASAS